MATSRGPTESRAALLGVHSPIQSAGDILSYIGMYTLKGIVAVWLYAVARPRFGPGPRTALIIGLAYWVIGYVIPVVSFEPLMLEEYAPDATNARARRSRGTRARHFGRSVVLC